MLGQTKKTKNTDCVMPALKRTRLTASAWRKANWCINCVLMRVMERRSITRRSITLINTQLIHQFKNTDCCGKTWVAGKADPLL